MEYVQAVKILKSKGIAARFQILGNRDPEHKRGIQNAVIDEWVQSGLIEYLGTAHDVRPVIAAADCVVLPSYREGTPRALLEAASSGKPMIATDVPGCHQVVRPDYNGFLCNLKDAEDLADKMEKMLTLNDAQLRTFGQNARRLVEQEYDENIVIHKYIHALREVRQAS